LTKRSLFALLTGAVLLFHGCGFGVDTNEDAGAVAATKSSGGPGEPRIQIVSPKPGEVIDVGQVEIRTRVSDFELVDKIGKKNKKGQGHIVYYRLESEDARIPTQKNVKAYVGGEGAFTSFSGAQTTYVWPDTPGQNVPPGTYTFAVQLVQNNRTPLSPPQVAEVQVEVTE
jgi:hypothetical protein